MTDLSEIRRRIAQLRQMTVERGCTEAEALAAAAKVAELMARHGLSAEEVDAPEIGEAQADLARKRRRPIDKLWGMIAWFCRCQCYFTADRNGVLKLVYVGRAPWPDVAEYLHQVCARAVSAAVVDYKRSADYRRRRTAKTRLRAIDTFVGAMVEALTAKLFRLWQQAANRDEHKRDVALAKQALDQVPLRDLPELRRRKLRYSDDARLAGAIAGLAVHVHHGVSAGQAAPIGLIEG